MTQLDIANRLKALMEQRDAEQWKNADDRKKIEDEILKLQQDQAKLVAEQANPMLNEDIKAKREEIALAKLLYEYDIRKKKLEAWQQVTSVVDNPDELAYLWELSKQRLANARETYEYEKKRIWLESAEAAHAKLIEWIKSWLIKIDESWNVTATDSLVVWEETIAMYQRFYDQLSSNTDSKLSWYADELASLSRIGSEYTTQQDSLNKLIDLQTALSKTLLDAAKKQEEESKRLTKEESDRIDAIAKVWWTMTAAQQAQVDAIKWVNDQLNDSIAKHEKILELIFQQNLAEKEKTTTVSNAVTEASNARISSNLTWQSTSWANAWAWTNTWTWTNAWGSANKPSSNQYWTIYYTIDAFRAAFTQYFDAIKSEFVRDTWTLLKDATWAKVYSYKLDLLKKQWRRVWRAEWWYTGDGAKYDIAGLVHKWEYVVPKNLVWMFANNWILWMIEWMRTWRWFANWWMVSASLSSVSPSSNVNITFWNVSVRNDQDIQNIAKAVKQVFTRERILSNKGIH